MNEFYISRKISRHILHVYKAKIDGYQRQSLATSFNNYKN